MFKLKIFLVELIALCCILGSASSKKIINCYWGSWSHYRPGNGAFKVENIDPKLCTHLSYSFQGINDMGEIKVLDPWLDMSDGLDNMAKTIELKKVNPDLKVLVVVGGWNEGSASYSRMAADPAKRKAFIQSVLKFIQVHKFDGFDLDWEYPCRREGASPNDKANFVTLLKEMYQALHAQGYLFSIAVGASPEHAEISYQLPEIANYLDFINVMTYDFVTPDGRVIGYNAPLKGQGGNNVESAMKYWLSKGVPADKLVMGLPFYGHPFGLVDGKRVLGSPSTNPITVGPYTRQAGFLGYNEICEMIDSYTYEWAEAEGVPVLYNSKELISYDNAESIAQKVDLANELKLAGVMIWSIETDDFRGLCGPKNILLKTINNKMGNPQDMSPSVNDTLDIEKGTNAPKQPTEPNNDGVSGDCSVDGIFPHKSSCAHFIHCANGIAYEKECPPGLHFDANISNCNYPNLVNCQ